MRGLFNEFPLMDFQMEISLGSNIFHSSYYPPFRPNLHIFDVCTIAFQGSLLAIAPLLFTAG